VERNHLIKNTEADKNKFLRNSEILESEHLKSVSTPVVSYAEKLGGRKRTAGELLGAIPPKVSKSCMPKSSVDSVKSCLKKSSVDSVKPKPDCVTGNSGSVLLKPVRKFCLEKTVPIPPWNEVKMSIYCPDVNFSSVVLIPNRELMTKLTLAQPFVFAVVKNNLTETWITNLTENLITLPSGTLIATAEPCVNGSSASPLNQMCRVENKAPEVEIVKDCLSGDLTFQERKAIRKKALENLRSEALKRKSTLRAGERITVPDKNFLSESNPDGGSVIPPRMRKKKIRKLSSSSSSDTSLHTTCVQSRKM